MSHKNRFILLLLVLLLIVSVTPTLAQRASMSLIPVWRPGEQLTSAPLDDRFVDIQFFAQGNVQFWAASVTCNFGRTTYLTNPSVTWGPDWGVQNNDFAALPVEWDLAGNNLTFTATRQGSSTPPMGFNNQDYTILLATVRMQVEGSTNANVSITCRGLDFLDRDGRSVVRARQNRTAPLVVRTGYTFSGTVLYQGARNHDGITVDCNNTDTAYDPPPIQTDRNGAFSLSTLREFGSYNCVFSTSAYDPPFLPAYVNFDLQTPTLTLLPVTLRSGDIAQNNDQIDTVDIGVFTGGFTPGPTDGAYQGNDVNGDARLDESDLAIVAANFGIDILIPADHLIYGIATDYGGDWPNSRIYWGDPLSGTVQTLVNSRRDRDFWPHVSPDGSTVAFIRAIARRGTTTYTLYTGPTVGRGRTAQLTPRRGFTYDSFAPSWSPDGQRVAFICSNDGDTTGYQFNQGNLCVINADGSNFQMLDSTGMVKIYPPAWYDNNTLIYAGVWGDSFFGDPSHPTCPGKLCSYDFNQNTTTAVDPGSVFGGANDFTDMPAMSDNDGTPVLFYRYYDSGAGYHTLRAAEISYDSATLTYTIAAHGTSTHLTSWGSPDEGVDYYAVSPTLSVILTTYDVDRLNNLNEYYTPPSFWKASTDTLIWLFTTHNVDGFVGNPLEVTGPGASGLWDGEYSTPTLLHVHRATIDWIP